MAAITDSGIAVVPSRYPFNGVHNTPLNG